MVIRYQPADHGNAVTAGPTPPRRRAGERVPVLRHLGFWLRALPALLAALLIPVLLAWGYLRLTPAEYEATASVFADISAPGGDARQAHGARLTSAAVLDSVMARGDLAGDLRNLPEATWGDRLVNRVAQWRMQSLPAPATGELRDRLGRAARAAPALDANVLDVSVRAYDAGAAQRLANALADALVLDIARLAPVSGQGDAARTEELRQRAQTAQARLAEATAAGKSGKNSGKSRAESLKALHDSALKAAENGQEIEAVAQRLASPAVEKLRLLYGEAVAQEASMRASLGSRHPSTLEAQQQVEDKGRLLREGLRLAAAGLEAEWRKAQADERTNPSLASSDGTLAALQRAEQEASAAYQQQLRGSGASPAGSAVARVLRPAVTPAAPVAPKAAIIGMAALGVGALWATWLAWRAVRRWRVWRQDQLRALPRLQEDETATLSAPLPAGGSVALPPPQSVEQLVQEISNRAETSALQTVLIIGNNPDDVAEAALQMAGATAGQHLRVLLLDGHEANPALSRLLRDAPVSGHILLNGRRRILASIEPGPTTPVWFAPALSSLATTAAGDLPLIIPALAGHFDCLIISGPGAGAENGLGPLAAASDSVICVGRPGLLASHLPVIPADRLRIMAGLTLRHNRRSGRVLRLDIAS